MREPMPAATRASACRFASSIPSMPLDGAAPMSDEVVLAFDFGTRRIGVAIGNTLTGQARPLAVVDERDPWPRIEALLAEWQPARLVAGIPRHPDGAAHDMTRRCERFARQLEGRFRLPVARVDERWSTAVADDGRDDRAAAVILQQWLDDAHAHPARHDAGEGGPT
jgi:putative Holliday junction resolvase